MKRAEDHLLSATKARSYLKSQVSKAKEELKKSFADKGLAIPGIHSCLPAMSHVMEVHYSFDFAQQVGRLRKKETVMNSVTFRSTSPTYQCSQDPCTS